MIDTRRSWLGGSRCLRSRHHHHNMMSSRCPGGYSNKILFSFPSLDPSTLRPYLVGIGTLDKCHEKFCTLWQCGPWEREAASSTPYSIPVLEYIHTYICLQSYMHTHTLGKQKKNLLHKSLSLHLLSTVNVSASQLSSEELFSL